MTTGSASASPEPLLRGLGIARPETAGALWRSVVLEARGCLEEEAGPGRDPERRRRYAGDPWAYFRDVLGHHLTGQQERALEAIEQHDRTLIPSGNNIGKTFVLAGYGVYRMDAVAALPDEDAGLEEQGARILLPGPDRATIQATIYAEILEQLRRALSLGHAMPGRWSENSVLWRVRPKWEVEAFSPPASVRQQVAHTASGRHHANQVALIEEGAGVDEAVWRAAEGMCSSRGNKIVSSFNPTEASGPAFQREQDGRYHTLHLDAFDHPNVRERRYVIPAAVDFRKIDARVRAECRDRGAWPGTALEPDHGDFVYAVPPGPDAPEAGPREDGQLGHPGGTCRVYRPSPTFSAQVRGRWPGTSDLGLFDPAAFDQAAERWKERPLRTGYPDRLGVDVAREGGDDTCLCPSWGETAETLLRAYAEAQEEYRSAEYLEKLRADRRVYTGELKILPKGDGPDTATRIAALFPGAPCNVDEGGVGASVHDHLSRVIGADSAGISFGAAPPDPVPGEPWSENLRTAMYVRASMLLDRGLIDVPPDHLLREELMAQRLLHKTRTVRKGRLTRRVPSVLLEAKAEVRKRIGRSPDRADAFVLSIVGASVAAIDPGRWATVTA